MFSEIDSFLSVMGKVFVFFKNTFKNKDSREDLISARLVEAFQAHGVNRNQIPRAIGFGLKVNDVRSDDSFLEKLDEEIIDFSCNLLGVRRDWLDGVSSEVYPKLNFYKQLDKFEAFISEIINQFGTSELDGVLITCKKNYRSEDSVLIIQQKVGYINENPFYRFYLCKGWVSSYWKSRWYLTAFIAICWKNNIHVHGKYVSNKIIQSVLKNKTLLDFGSDGIYSLKGKHWYAEDLALDPEIYLDGVDPEKEEYGLKSALLLWVELHDKGYMECGLPNKNTKNKFYNYINDQ